jgi:hypothetical protein
MPVPPSLRRLGPAAAGLALTLAFTFFLTPSAALSGENEGGPRKPVQMSARDNLGQQWVDRAGFVPAKAPGAPQTAPVLRTRASEKARVASIDPAEWLRQWGPVERHERP